MKDPYYSDRLKKSRMMRKERRNIKPLSEEIESVSRLLIGTIGVMLLVISVSFLYISSLQAAKGYHLRQLQIDHEELLIENRDLQRDLNKAMSITQLNAKEEVQRMVGPTNNETRYIGTGTEFAAR